LNVLGQKNAFDDILDFLPIRNSCSSTAGSDENRAKKYNYEDFDIQDVSVTTCPISKKSYIFIIFNQSTTTISSLYSKNTSFILIYEIGKKGCIKVLNLSVKASFLEISKNLKSIYIGTFLGFVQEVDVSDLLGGGRKRVEEFSSHNSSDVFEPNTQDILVKSHQVTQTETTPVKNADSAHQNHSILNKFGSYFSNYLTPKRPSVSSKIQKKSVSTASDSPQKISEASTTGKIEGVRYDENSVWNYSYDFKNQTFKYTHSKSFQICPVTYGFWREVILLRPN